MNDNFLKKLRNRILFLEKEMKKYDDVAENRLPESYMKIWNEYQKVRKSLKKHNITYTELFKM